MPLRGQDRRPPNGTRPRIRALPRFTRSRRRRLRPWAARHGLRLPDGEPVEDDDHWRDEIGPLPAGPVPVVSFTFGLPGRSIVAELRRAGTVVVQTVASADEARCAAGIGVDVVIVQASAAGGHSATFTPAHLPAPLRCRN
ncbi:nitronate monooxygenase [Streptomyces sp. NPDC004365]